VTTEVPIDMPVTAPDEGFMAAPALPELHVPPDVPLLRVVTCPIHTNAPPAIGTGEAFTVREVMALQVLGNVYNIEITPGK
jgi:hypothetical protein